MVRGGVTGGKEGRCIMVKGKLEGEVRTFYRQMFDVMTEDISDLNPKT